MNRLKECRINANIKQEALAKMIGVTQGAISAWEVGRSEPSSQSWKKISEALGVSVDYLMGNDDPAVADNAPPDNTRFAFYGGADVGSSELSQMQCLHDRIVDIGMITAALQRMTPEEVAAWKQVILNKANDK